MSCACLLYVVSSVRQPPDSVGVLISPFFHRKPEMFLPCLETSHHAEADAQGRNLRRLILNDEHTQKNVPQDILHPANINNIEVEAMICSRHDNCQVAIIT